MYSQCYRMVRLVVVLLCCWLAAGPSSHLRAQMMSSVVDSPADDSLAYPWDDPNTPDVDESMDGICEDAAHRCTLRAALDEASIIDIPANVSFSISGTITVNPQQGAFRPRKGSKILGVDRNVTIEGSGLFSFLMALDSNTTVEGLEFGIATEGIDVAGSGNIIGGTTLPQANVFQFMSQSAINLIGDSNTVIGNFIGLSDVNTAGGNQFGIFVIGAKNTIGGTLPGQRNVISGNYGAGISIAVDTSNGKGGGNKIIGNFIGTDTGGTHAIPNQNGIEVLVAPDLMIGGPTSAERNVISGNSNSGVLVGIEAKYVTIQGNYIGTDSSGTAPLPNRDGVTLGPGSKSCFVQDNQISSNTGNGVVISGIDTTLPLRSTAHLISGNEITLNGRAGVEIFGDARSNVIGSSLTTNFPPNQIQRNVLYGVSALSAAQGTPTWNTFRKNVWLDNGTKGINIVSAQDTIKAPTILSYYEIIDTTQAIVTGTHGRPGSLIDLYTGENQTTSHYEGRRWLGAGYVQSNHTFSITIARCNCSRIVATATDPLGTTSEFSASLVTSVVIGHEHNGQPANFYLGDAYPNPFNPNTTIRYELPRISRVTLRVYNLLGQEAATLVNEEESMGSYEVRWDASRYSSGVYFYRLQAGKFVDVKKLLLMR